MKKKKLKFIIPDSEPQPIWFKFNICQSDIHQPVKCPACEGSLIKYSENIRKIKEKLSQESKKAEEFWKDF